jgi:hypothetical protein
MHPHQKTNVVNINKFRLGLFLQTKKGFLFTGQPELQTFFLKKKLVSFPLNFASAGLCFDLVSRLSTIIACIGNFCLLPVLALRVHVLHHHMVSESVCVREGRRAQITSSMMEV